MRTTLDEAEHAVRFFQREGAILEAVTDYASAALAEGAPVLLAMSTANGVGVVARLLRRGHKDARARVTLLDSEVVASTMRAEDGVAAAFRQHVEPAVGAARGRSSRPLRLYGDVVNVLWRRGAQEQAIELEGLWEGLARRDGGVRLLCGYRLDLLNGRCLDLVERHDAVHASEHLAGLEGRIENVLRRVLGDELEAVRAVVAAEARLASLPFAQAALMWIGRNRPALAGRVAAHLAA